MVITVERFPSTKQKITVGFTEQGLATMEKVGARGSHGFPWGHRTNESTGLTPEARKYTVTHGENIAFGDESRWYGRTPSVWGVLGRLRLS